MIQALLWAESESQKAILIGAGGSMVGRSAPRRASEIEAATGPPRCTSTCSVRVRKGWRGDDALLDRLGIE